MNYEGERVREISAGSLWHLPPFLEGGSPGPQPLSWGQEVQDFGPYPGGRWPKTLACILGGAAQDSGL